MQFDARASRLQDEMSVDCTHAGGRPCLPIFEFGPDAPIYRYVLFEGDRVRFIVLDDVEGKTVTISVLAPDKHFEEFVVRSQKVLETVAWEEGD